MAKLLDLVTEIKSGIRSRQTRLEAQRLKEDEAPVVSAGISTFRANKETHTGLGHHVAFFINYEDTEYVTILC